MKNKLIISIFYGLVVASGGLAMRRAAPLAVRSCIPQALRWQSLSTQVPRKNISSQEVKRRIRFITEQFEKAKKNPNPRAFEKKRKAINARIQSTAVGIENTLRRGNQKEEFQLQEALCDLVALEEKLNKMSLEQLQLRVDELENEIKTKQLPLARKKQILEELKVVQARLTRENELEKLTTLELEVQVDRLESEIKTNPSLDRKKEILRELSAIKAVLPRRSLEETIPGSSTTSTPSEIPSVTSAKQRTWMEWWRSLLWGPSTK